MAENNNNFKSTVEALFQGMDGMISSKTVVGDAIHVGDTIILPLVDVSFGIGAGSFRAEKREKGMGGIGGKITPSATGSSSLEMYFLWARHFQMKKYSFWMKKTS